MTPDNEDNRGEQRTFSVRFRKDGSIEVKGLSDVLRKWHKSKGKGKGDFVLTGLVPNPWPVKPDPDASLTCPPPPNIVCPCFLQEMK